MNNNDHVSQNIENEINSNDVMLFMKGTPVFPMCGFSARVVEILNKVGVKFGSVNVLESDEMREGIKTYSNWPTIPQLYVKKEFIGGCDIITEMFESGELLELFNTILSTTTGVFPCIFTDKSLIVVVISLASVIPVIVSLNVITICFEFASNTTADDTIGAVILLLTGLLVKDVNTL